MLNRPLLNDDEDEAHARAGLWRPSSLFRFHLITGALKRLWRYRYAVLLLISAAVVAQRFAIPALLGPIVPADPVIKAEFVQSVVASGHVEAPFRVNIGSQIIGIVADVPVAEGQTVKAGDTLIVLDDREARAGVVQAEGMVAQTEARMRQLKEVSQPASEESLKQAKATLINAQQSFERAKKLAGDGYGTKATLDDAQKTLDIAQAQVRNAELQVFTNKAGGSDYVMAETQLNQARASLTTAQSRLSYTIIKAPRDGVLISRNVERGNVVQPSNVLMMLSPFLETQLVVQIDEKNLRYVSVGEKALASADAFPDQNFVAEVVYINPGIDLQRASVELKLRAPEPPAYLRQDMTVSVDIETARHPGMLVVPSANIRGFSNGKTWVMKAAGGRALRQPVKVGLSSAGKAEILDGLQEGDVTLAAPESIKQGSKVRPQVSARTP
jgi:HlyD family secretion protein